MSHVQNQSGEFLQWSVFRSPECAAAESLGWSVHGDVGRHMWSSSAGACFLISNEAEVGAPPLSVTAGKCWSLLCASWPADETMSFSTTPLCTARATQAYIHRNNVQMMH